MAMCNCGSRFVRGACLDCLSVNPPIFSMKVEGLFVVRDVDKDVWYAYRPVAYHRMTYFVCVGSHHDFQEAIKGDLIDIAEAKAQLKQLGKQIEFLEKPSKLVSSEWKQRHIDSIMQKMAALHDDIKKSDNFDKRLRQRIVRALSL